MTARWLHRLRRGHRYQPVRIHPTADSVGYWVACGVCLDRKDERPHGKAF